MTVCHGELEVTLRRRRQPGRGYETALRHCSCRAWSSPAAHLDLWTGIGDLAAPSTIFPSCSGRAYDRLALRDTGRVHEPKRAVTW